jgi:hypothetical protein
MRRARLLLLAAGCLGAAACSGPPDRTGVVSGRVTLGGAPLPGGRVHLKALSPDAQVMVTTAMIEPDGTYSCTEAPTGPVGVAVETESVKKLIQLWEGGAAACPFKHVPIPKRYADAASSGFGLEVRPGKQTYDIPLDR